MVDELNDLGNRWDAAMGDVETPGVVARAETLSLIRSIAVDPSADELQAAGKIAHQAVLSLQTAAGAEGGPSDAEVNADAARQIGVAVLVAAQALNGEQATVFMSALVSEKYRFPKTFRL